MFSSTRSMVLLLLAIALVALVADASGPMDEQSKELAAKYMVSSPNNLVRLLFYNARERPMSFKRSSSALDPLAGITLGKRSISPVELLNLEPMYGRYHSGANMYHLRWAPVTGYEALEDD